jgi:hypothetical protein
VRQDHTDSIAAAPSASRRSWRSRRPSTRTLTGLALLTALAVAVTATALAVSGAGGSHAASGEEPPTTLATVARRDLSAQTQVDGTLGYTGSSTIILPPGTAPSAVRQARQTLASQQAQLNGARATLAADQRSLEQVEAKLAADRQSLINACRGDNAAQGSSSSSGSQPTSNPCATFAQTVASDEESVTSMRVKVSTDAASVASARVAVAGTSQSRDVAEFSAVSYETGATYTSVPSAGDVIRRGRALISIGGQPVLLLYGNVTAWRAFRPGMTEGRDVGALNANLRALGYGRGLTGDRFMAATESAVQALQSDHGLLPTGELLLGSIVFRPGPVRVKAVKVARGAAVQPGPILSVTSTRHEVAVNLDASQQSQVKVGDSVTITLPDTTSTAGIISAVGTVATAASQDSGPTVEVDIRLLDEAAAGRLDGAPVQVSITTATATDALTVPVTSLLALAGGGYALEVVGPAGTHRLVPVALGLFDDAEGLVQVSGSGVKPGQRVVVPGS